MELDFAISKGLKFLKDHQLSNGGFSCLFACSENCTADALEEFSMGDKKCVVIVEETTVFPATLIGHSLLYLRDNSEAQEILNQIADFLIEKRSSLGIWRHYTKPHQLEQFAANDLDNSAMASWFLQQLGRPALDNRDLFISNRSKEGPFYSWITLRLQWNSNPKYWRSLWREFRHPIGQYYFWKLMPCAKHDIDAVVNSNVIHYLGENQYTAAAIDLMVRVIVEEREEMCDKWYLRPVLIYYFFSKNMNKGIEKLEELKPIIKNRILAQVKSDGQFFESILDTALAIAALENMGYYEEIPAKSIQYLLAAQNSNGAWKKGAIYYAYERADESAAFGGEEISTAIVLEALVRYQSHERSRHFESTSF
jgi:hypothetical protein